MTKGAIQHSNKMGRTGNYASVNGLEMYYEIHGSGSPLVLIHGTLSTIETSFAKTLPLFAETWQVIAIEEQAHGHTPDIDRPLTYKQMAEDTAALLRQLEIKNADFFGYSMGGGIALEIAIQWPDLVRKFVFAGGTSYHPDGFYPELLAASESMDPDSFAGTPFQEAYAKVAPNPENWPRLVAKIQDLDLKFEGWTPEQLQAIKAPALLIIGDSDIVRPEHVVQMFRLLGGGVIGDIVGLPRSQLAILPGTTHMMLVERADWLHSMISSFLESPMPNSE